MDAIEFLKAYKRLCNFAKHCEKCPMNVILTLGIVIHL